MKPCIPDALPLRTISWEDHVSSIGMANAALARYDGMLQSIINPSLLLSPLTTQEAVLSSRIEGTQATLAEVLRYDVDPNDLSQKNRVDDIQEIQNYREAVHFAVIKMPERSLSLNLIREVHAKLLNSVRGRNKAPGEFRRVQNFIAPPGANIEQASFIPPSPDQLMPALDNWERYVHAQEKDPLVQLAVVKAQFEIIHPFLDGNGRIGRILVPLFLYLKGVLSSPTFYISAYLEEHRDEYYARLNAVSANSDWDGWIEFFLQAIIEQSQANIDKTKAIHNLYEKYKTLIPILTKSQFATKATDALFSSPFLTSESFEKQSEIPSTSVDRILKVLRENKILHDVRPPLGRRSGIYLFDDLYQIIK